MIKLRDGSEVSAESYFVFKKNMTELIQECLDNVALLSLFASWAHGDRGYLDTDSYSQACWKIYGLIDEDSNVSLSTLALFRNFSVRDASDRLGWSYRWPAEDEIDHE